jgi:hypothetical protein
MLTDLTIVPPSLANAAWNGVVVVCADRSLVKTSAILV